MEFLFCDISLFFLSFVSVILVLFSIFSVTAKLTLSVVEEFRVIDFIRALKKVCPVTLGNKWKLLSLSAGPSRCWTKKFQFPGFSNDINLYGAVCTATCSPMYAFSLIADVSRWGEWDVLSSANSLLVEPYGQLKRDDFMLADQVVGMEKGTNVQLYVAMYRFMSPSEKNTRWILFWNAKSVEVMFFLIQPAVSKTVNCQSAVTYIHGTLNPSNHAALIVSQQIRNIKDFLCISQLHLVGSSYSPSTPILSVREASSNNKPQEDYRPSECKSPDSTAISFVLVPIIQPLLKYGFKRVKGFHLTVNNISEMPVLLQKPQQSQQETSSQTPTIVKVLRRTASDTAIQPPLPTGNKTQPKVTRRNSLHNLPQETKGSQNTVIKQKSLDTIEENSSKNPTFKLEKSKKVTTQDVPKVTEPLPQKSASSLSDVSEIQSDEDSFVNIQIMNKGTEDNVSYDKYEIFTSSASDFEVIDSSQQYLACKLADFLTQGNYGASELQAEMVMASQWDDKLAPGDQGIGGWIYHSTYKGIRVLSKTITGRFMKIVSFLCQSELSVPAKDAWKCVKNPRFRFISDETVKTVKVIERISHTQRLIHVYHESSGFLKKECTDFCLLQTEREEKNKYYSCFHSIEYEKCPLMTSVVRGSLRPSGWVVEKVGLQKCKITYLMQILVSSPDSLYIHELSSLVPLSLHNLKHYTASNPK